MACMNSITSIGCIFVQSCINAYGVKTACCIAFISSLLLGAVLYCFSYQLAALMLTGKSAIEYTAGFLRYFAFTLILLNLIFVFRSCVQGLGKPLFPMCYGIVEMLIRIPVIYIGLPLNGFRATAYAEGLAWAGALTINLMAYIHFFFCIRHDKML